MKPLIKICGMKYNVAEVALLQPHYLGFIFYPKSPRNFEESRLKIPKSIKKVGVFVNASIDFIFEKQRMLDLDVIQLHGNESVTYIERLKKKLPSLKIWKVIAVNNPLNFQELEVFEKHIDSFLFDTKGRHPGGNGYKFSWELLKDYPFKTPIIISGGIGPDDATRINEFISEYKLPVIAIDVNSQFEIEPGLKDTNALKNFMYELQCK